jgi:hypothetical protein
MLMVRLHAKIPRVEHLHGAVYSTYRAPWVQKSNHVRLRRGPLSFAARPRRLRREAQPAFRREPNERAADIGAVAPPLFESVA